MPGDALQPLLTGREVAELLQVPEQTLYAWRCKGEGPEAYKIGRHLRYDRAEVLRWLKTRTGRR
jgi:excisionase family DNA binding protein